MTNSTVDKIWYTRCPVPTASGLAYNLGWIADEFASVGLDVGVLQDAGPELARHHLDHQLVGLFREGGNVPALAARSEGAPTRLIGLTWIDEWQSILVRDGSGITGAEGLRGARVALPRWGRDRAESFPRAMALHGIKGALRIGGLTLDDVRFVEVGGLDPSVGRDRQLDGLWPGLSELAAGEVDAVYGKGARSAEQAREVGAVVAIELDGYPDRRTRVNNGTPRPIIVHERILVERPELVVRFLAQTLRAADWAADHLDDVRAILARETRSGAEGVTAAYRNDFHRCTRRSTLTDSTCCANRRTSCSCTASSPPTWTWTPGPIQSRYVRRGSCSPQRRVRWPGSPDRLNRCGSFQDVVEEVGAGVDERADIRAADEAVARAVDRIQVAPYAVAPQRFG